MFASLFATAGSALFSRLRSIAALLLLAGAFSASGQGLPTSVPITPVVTGLSGPVGVFGPPDGSGRLFVIQQGGAVREIKAGALQATPFLTLSNTLTQCRETPAGALQVTGFTSGGERGLLGMAFHPNFAGTGTGAGQFFLSFTSASGHATVVRYTMANPNDDLLSAADLTTCLVILRIDHGLNTNHNGGNIVFGPDGYLYYGMGDGGSGNDPCSRGQTINPANLDNTTGCASQTSFTDPDGNGTPDRPTTTRALLGKMMRLDIDGTTPAGANELCGARLDGAANYAIPADNPFIGTDAQHGCDEIWAYGLRNPWRWSFDRQTKDLIIGDVGQDTWEEVDLWPFGSANGTNFGWKLCEGTHNRGSCTTLCTTANTAVPIIEYNNSGNGCSSSTTPPGCSVTGGARYRGPDPTLSGVYFYGDACNSELRFSVDQGSNMWVQPSAATIVTRDINNNTFGAINSFGQDRDGVLYFVAGANLYRIGAAVDPNALFRDGFE